MSLFDLPTEEVSTAPVKGGLFGLPSQDNSKGSLFDAPKPSVAQAVNSLPDTIGQGNQEVNQPQSSVFDKIAGGISTFFNSVAHPIGQLSQGVTNTIENAFQNGIHPIDAIKNYFSPAPAFKAPVGTGLTSDQTTKAQQTIENVVGKELPDFTSEDLSLSDAALINDLYTKQQYDQKQGIIPTSNISPDLAKLATEKWLNLAMGVGGAGDLKEVNAGAGGHVTNSTLQQFAKETNPIKIQNALTKVFNIPEDVAGEISPDLAKAKTVQEVKDVLLGKPLPETGPINVKPIEPQTLQTSQEITPEGLQDIADEIKTKSQLSTQPETIVNQLSTKVPSNVNPELQAIAESVRGTGAKAEKSNQIIVGRHGDIDKVNEGIAHGQTNDPLNPEGIKDAEKLGQEWQKQGVKTIVSSDLPRGKQTADIASQATGALVRTDPRLRTWNIGELDGKPKAEVDKKLESYRENPNEVIPGGESFKQFTTRVDAGLKANKGPNTAFVLHNEILKSLGHAFETGETKTISLDQKNKVIDNKEHDNLGAINKSNKQSSEGEKPTDTTGFESTRPNRDNEVFAGEVSRYYRARGEDTQLDTGSAKKFTEGGVVDIKDSTFDILTAGGFSDELVNKLRTAFDKGAVKKLSLSTEYKGTKIEAAFSENTLYLHPELTQKENFKNGNIINHELDGHSWYTKLSPENRNAFYENLKTNKDVIKQAWEDTKNDHPFYWNKTVDSLGKAIWMNSTLETAQDVMKFVGMKSDNEIPLDTFIERTLNIDKTIDAINNELERRGISKIEIKPYDTLAVMEHNAVIAENASNLTANDTSIVNRYIGDIQDGTLKFGEDSVKALTYPGETDLTLKTLEKLKGRDFVSKTFISDLTNASDLKQQEKDILRSVISEYPDGAKIQVQEFADKVKTQLLPLNRNTKVPKFNSNGKKNDYGGQTRTGFEMISLPDNLRGSVGDYYEAVYDSPIKTSAGQVHFGISAPNYFGHTRIEDMAGGEVKQTGVDIGGLPIYEIPNQVDNPSTTRRVIEVQSDLFQKGRLEQENSHWSLLQPTENYNKLVERLGKPEVDRMMDARRAEVSKLGQYSNPTAHFRMVREEIKQAAKDGKTALQFPTGETAMKIEGLGQNVNQWYEYHPEENLPLPQGTDTKLKPENLKVGKQIVQSGGHDWIITDVLGDGKFKAVPKNSYDIAKNMDVDYGVGTQEERIMKALKGSSAEESFDISGKVDINNPIYRFYEKDLGRYLKNNYNAKPVTDAQGVSWYEVPIKPEQAIEPVTAFRVSKKDEANFDTGNKLEDVRKTLEAVQKRVGVKATNVEQLTRMLEREQMSLNAAKAAPEAHAKAYGEDRKPKYEAKIVELKERIQAQTPKPTIPPAPKIRVSNKDVQIPEDLYHRQLAVDMTREALSNSPFGQLLKYVAKSGEFEGKLPEVLGKKASDLKGLKSVGKIKNANVLDFIKRGDQIIQEVFGAGETYAQAPDVEQVRSDMEDYMKKIEGLKEEAKNVKTDISKFMTEEKDRIATERLAQAKDKEAEKVQMAEEKISQKQADIESLREWKSLVSTYAHEANLPQSLDEVVPPTVRGDIQSPELNFSKWKDKRILALNRDTFERNLEKVAPTADANKLKKFLVEPVRKNEFNRTKFNNELKLKTHDKLKEWGIKRNTLADELIQKYGEGLISVEELEKLAPKKADEIKQAAAYFRKTYDSLLDRWNEVRKEYGYPEVYKRKDYFRHFDEINFFTKTYGFLRKQDELPTEIAGKTEFFKPGKPFSTAELSRTGNKTKYSAIGGFNNYIDSVSRQIFHINSIQRGRALERYLEESAKVARRIGDPLQLSNVIANIREYVNNGLAGKTATLDRAIENTIGRPALKAFETIQKLIGKNIIVGNLSTALSHLVSLPLIAVTTDTLPLMKSMMTTLTSPLMSQPFTTIDGQESSYLIRRFPIEEIMPTMPKTAEAFLSYIFTATDKFKSRLAVAGKYYEGIKDGLEPEEAMKQADIYAGKVLGDYSLGQKPNLMNAKTMTLLAQFQLGLNDSMSVLLHDIPEEASTETTDEETGQTKKTTSKWKLISKFLQFAIYSYFFNLLLKQIRGSGKGIDPIDLGMTLTGMNEEGAEKPITTRLGLAGTDLLGELPFSSIFTGSFPLATAFSGPTAKIKKGDFKGAAIDLLTEFASPIGGGAQAKKTIQGIQAYRQGIVSTASGIPKYDIPRGVGSAIQVAVFGPSGSQEAQSYYDTTGAQNPLKATYDEVQQLLKEGKDDEAQAVVDALSDEDYKKYQDVRTAAKSAETKKAEVDELPTAQKIQTLIAQGKDDQAQTLVDAMSDNEYKAYQGAKKMLTKVNKVATNTFGSGSSTWDKQSFVTHIATIAKAVGLHPIQFFDNVFQKAGDWKVTGVENGQVIVARFPESESQAIKIKANKNTPDFKLDHTVPLEIGGANNTNNLQLLTTDQWSQNTPVEDYLGKALNNGTITGTQAREYAIRFKAGLGEPLSDALMSEYKNKYNSKPLSFDEIQNLVEK